MWVGGWVGDVTIIGEVRNAYRVLVLTPLDNGLPKAIKDISSKPKNFKIALKHYLLTHLFYSLDELFSKK